VAAIVVAGLAMASAACGDDDGDESGEGRPTGMEFVRGSCAEARAKGEVRVRSPLGRLQALAEAEQGLAQTLATGAEQVPDRRAELRGLRFGHEQLLKLYLRPAKTPREARHALRDGVGLARSLGERAQSAGLPECAPPTTARDLGE
jgi:hypothetical protein